MITIILWKYFGTSLSYELNGERNEDPTFIGEKRRKCSEAHLIDCSVKA